MTRTGLLTAGLAALAAGCSGFRTTMPQSTQRTQRVEGSVLSVASVAPLLTAADGGSPGDDGTDELDGKTVVVHLPPAGGWPRLLTPKGPVYALLQLNPYVGQLGVLSDYKRADAGTGFGLVVGYRTPLANAQALGFELAIERSGHRNEAARTDATATRIIGAARLSLKMDEALTPYVVAGGGSYGLDSDGLDPAYNLSGLGIMVGGGVDYSPNESFTLRAGLDLHIWSAAEEDGDGGTAETLALALGAAVSF